MEGLLCEEVEGERGSGRVCYWERGIKTSKTRVVVGLLAQQPSECLQLCESCDPLFKLRFRLFINVEGCRGCCRPSLGSFPSFVGCVCSANLGEYIAGDVKSSFHTIEYEIGQSMARYEVR